MRRGGGDEGVESGRTPGDVIAVNSPSPIRAAIFDLGGVVIALSRGQTIRIWAEAIGIPADEIRRRFADMACYHRFERGEVAPEDFYRHTCEKLGHGLSPEAFSRGWNAILGGPIPGIQALLARLSTRLRLVLLSNTNIIHAAEWRRTCAGVLGHFERVFTSYEMGCRKPEPECFRMVLDYLGLPPEQVVCFDDSPENVAAAAALGMVARCAAGPEDAARELRTLAVETRD